MDDLIVFINVMGSAAVFGVCVWAILSYRVRDGMLIKLGLITVAVGSIVTAYHLADGLNCHDLHPLNRARALVQIGLIEVAVGLYLRLRAGERLRDIVQLNQGNQP